MSFSKRREAGASQCFLEEVGQPAKWTSDFFQGRHQFFFDEDGASIPDLYTGGGGGVLRKCIFEPDSRRFGLNNKARTTIYLFFFPSCRAKKRPRKVSRGHDPAPSATPLPKTT